MCFGCVCIYVYNLYLLKFLVDFSCFLIFNWEYFAPKGVPFKKYEFSERQEEKDRKRVSE